MLDISRPLLHTIWKSWNRWKSKNCPGCETVFFVIVHDRSDCKHSSACPLSERVIRRILHTNRKSHRYKLMKRQKREGENRMACCDDILQNAALPTNDETHFHLSGFVNNQNFWKIILSSWKPSPQERVTVSYAGVKNGVWGPYFFMARSKSVIVTYRYVTGMWRWYWPFYNENSDTLAIRVCGFNRIEQRREGQWKLWESWRLRLAMKQWVINGD